MPESDERTLCLTLTGMISKDDYEAMERGTLLYDALYAQLKLDSPG